MDYGNGKIIAQKILMGGQEVISDVTGRRNNEKESIRLSKNPANPKFICVLIWFGRFRPYKPHHDDAAKDKKHKGHK